MRGRSPSHRPYSSMARALSRCPVWMVPMRPHPVFSECPLCPAALVSKSCFSFKPAHSLQGKLCHPHAARALLRLDLGLPEQNRRLHHPGGPWTTAFPTAQPKRNSPQCGPSTLPWYPDARGSSVAARGRA